MVVCLRTVGGPPPLGGPEQELEAPSRPRRPTHRQHGDTFDAWIATPERDALTASEVHQAVDYRPITRHDVVGGYLNLPGLHKADLTPEEDI